MGLAAFNRMRRLNAQKIPTKEKAPQKQLQDMSYNELRSLAKDNGIVGANAMKKVDLLEALQPKEGE